MKKLNLNKQEVLKLTSAEQSAIVGGGIKRSKRLAGDCAYSRKYPSSDGTSCMGLFVGEDSGA